MKENEENVPLLAFSYLVDNVLHGSVKCNVVKRMNLMNHDVALGTVNVVLEVFDNAALAEGVEALGDGGSIHQVSRTYFTGYHLIDCADPNLSLPCRHRCYCSCCFCHFYLTIF